MQILFSGILAVLLLAGAAYAHRQIGIFTRGSTQVLLIRSVLIVVGSLFGWMGAYGQQEPGAQILWFLMGFGMVHVPAAVILFIKGQRGAGKS